MVLPPTLLTGGVTHNSFVTPDLVSCCDYNSSNTLFELIDETQGMVIILSVLDVLDVNVINTFPHPISYM